MATQDTAQRILDIAERLVQTRGYNGFSYADIAQAMKVTKASLHYHFPAKADLGARLIERYEKNFLAALERIDRDTRDAPGKLRRYAGILLDDDKDILKVSVETFEKTLRTNTLAPLLVAQTFAPFLQKSDAPRIVNVSSGGGQLADGADGWAPAYCISKTALNGVTSQLTAALPKFAINSVCPGWVRTDMGGANATRSIQEGASGVVWLAADAPQNETGKFWRDRKVIPW